MCMPYDRHSQCLFSGCSTGTIHPIPDTVRLLQSGKVVSKEIIYCLKPSSVHKQEKSWPHYLPRCLSQKPRDHAMLFPFFPPPTSNQRILSTLLSEEILTLCPFSLSCRHLRSGQNSPMRLQEAHYRFPWFYLLPCSPLYPNFLWFLPKNKPVVQE